MQCFYNSYMNQHATKIIFNEDSVSSCLRRGNKPMFLVTATGFEPEPLRLSPAAVT